MKYLLKENKLTRVVGGLVTVAPLNVATTLNVAINAKRHNTDAKCRNADGKRRTW